MLDENSPATGLSEITSDCLLQKRGESSFLGRGRLLRRVQLGVVDKLNLFLPWPCLARFSYGSHLRMVGNTVAFHGKSAMHFTGKMSARVQRVKILPLMVCICFRTENDNRVMVV